MNILFGSEEKCRKYANENANIGTIVFSKESIKKAFTLDELGCKCEGGLPGQVCKYCTVINPVISGMLTGAFSYAKVKEKELWFIANNKSQRDFYRSRLGVDYAVIDCGF